jgi:hypothetical protein
MMESYYYETDGTKEPIHFKSPTAIEAVQTAKRFAALKGDRLLLVYTEAQDVLYCAD